MIYFNRTCWVCIHFMTRQTICFPVLDQYDVKLSKMYFILCNFEKNFIFRVSKLYPHMLYNFIITLNIQYTYVLDIPTTKCSIDQTFTNYSYGAIYEVPSPNRTHILYIALGCNPDSKDPRIDRDYMSISLFHRSHMGIDV